MKLRNKKTGEIADLIEIVRIDDVSNEIYLRLSDKEGRTFKLGINSLAELNEEWEDYEEPKEYWYINASGDVSSICEDEENPEDTKVCIEIGNYFSSREEAEKAVKKLKAWKRLKDKGFRFNNWDLDADDEDVNVLLSSDSYKGNKVYDFAKDLDLLFGGEE